MEYKIGLNERYGYYEVENKPSEDELSDYYSKKYYQSDSDKKNKYQQKYTDLELGYIRQKNFVKHQLIKKYIGENTINNFLDIGCGEGFALDYFDSQGLSTLGIDFSSFGITTHNPNQIDNFRKGDVLKVLDDLIAEEKTFNLIWVDNVLEHVRDPEDLLNKCHLLCNENGFVIIEVPNDFSEFQKFLLKEKSISKNHWVQCPDHLNYFSPKSLSALCSAFGFEEKSQMTDFPIELFLLNENSNYYNNPSVGKQAHKSRLMFEKYISNHNNPEQLVSLYETLLNSGLGRQIIGLYQKKAN